MLTLVTPLLLMLTLTWRPLPAWLLLLPLPPLLPLLLPPLLLLPLLPLLPLLLPAWATEPAGGPA